MTIAAARTTNASNPSRTLDRVVGVDTQLPTKSCDMEKPYRPSHMLDPSRVKWLRLRANHVLRTAIVAKHTEPHGVPAIAAAPGVTKRRSCVRCKTKPAPCVGGAGST